jgi:2-phospho-L-lactate guanylyltransferase
MGRFGAWKSMGVRILIPAKCDGGKTRLAPLMEQSARELLCLDFLRNTLQVALPVAGTTVVVRDEKCAVAARSQGAAVLLDPRADLNAALDIGRSSIPAHDGILVCPIDLPWITPSMLRRMTKRANALSIVPDRHRSGTNLLWIPAAAVADFQFMFGPYSFARHLEQGRRLGIPIEMPAMEAAGFDIDDPDDFATWRARAQLPIGEPEVRAPSFELCREPG